MHIHSFKILKFLQDLYTLNNNVGDVHKLGQNWLSERTYVMFISQENIEKKQLK